MVLLEDLLHLVLSVSINLGGNHNANSTVDRHPIIGRQTGLDAAAHNARDAGVSSNHLNVFRDSLKQARSLVEERAGPVSVPEDTLQGILGDIKDLEAEVEKLIHGGSPDDDAASAGDDESDSESDDESDDCSFEDLLSATGGTGSQDSGESLSRRKANCKTGSLAGMKLKGNTPSKLSNMDNKGTGIGNTPATTPDNTSPVVTSQAALPVAPMPTSPAENASDDNEQANPKDQEAGDGEKRTTRITMTKTLTRTETVTLSSAIQSVPAPAAETTPSVEEDRPAVEQLKMKKPSTDAQDEDENEVEDEDDDDSVNDDAEEQQKQEDVAKTSAIPADASATVKTPPVVGAFRQFSNQTANQNFVAAGDARQSAKASKMASTTPKAAVDTAPQVFKEVVDQNATTTAQPMTGFKTMVRSASPKPDTSTQ